MVGQEEPSTLQTAGQFLSDTAGQMQSAVKGAADNVKAAVRPHLASLMLRLCQLPCSSNSARTDRYNPIDIFSKLIWSVCCLDSCCTCFMLLHLPAAPAKLPAGVGGIRLQAHIFCLTQTHQSSHHTA